MKKTILSPGQLFDYFLADYLELLAELPHVFQPRNNSVSKPDQVRFRGRTYQVLDRVRVARKSYLIVARLGRRGRTRYQAIDAQDGPARDMWAIHVLPRSRSAVQQIRAIRRAADRNTSLPRIVHFDQRRSEIRLVSAWIPGISLAAYLDAARGGKLAWPSPLIVMSRMRRLVHGLGLLHDYANIVHGDLSPDNIIVRDKPAELILIDFGSAWLAEQSTRRQAGDGTTGPYAAPELRGAHTAPDVRSDQFSISVILYELLTGQLPYENMGGKAGWPEYASDFAKSYVAPSRLARDKRRLPRRAWASIDALTGRGLALNPQDRFATGRAWRDEFDAASALLTTRPAPAGPVSRAVTFWLDRLAARLLTRRRGRPEKAADDR